MTAMAISNTGGDIVMGLVFLIAMSFFMAAQVLIVKELIKIRKSLGERKTDVNKSDDTVAKMNERICELEKILKQYNLQ